MNKSSKMILVDMAMWEGKIPHDPTPRRTIRSQWLRRKEEPIYPGTRYCTVCPISSDQFQIRVHMSNGKWTKYIIKLCIYVCIQILIIKEEIVYLGDRHMVGVKETEEQV